jgi:hypothetical protein
VMRVELLILLSSCIEYIAGQNNVTSAALGWNLKMLQGLSSQCTWNSGEASRNTGHALLALLGSLMLVLMLVLVFTPPTYI